MSVNYNSVFLKREMDDIKNFIDSFYLIDPSNTEAEFNKFIEYRNLQNVVMNNIKILTANEYFWRNINDILLNSINSWYSTNTWVFYKGCLMTFNNNVLEINEKTYDDKLKKDVIFVYEDGLYRRKYYLSSDIDIYYFTSKSVNKNNDLNNLKNYGYYDEASNYKSKRIKLGEYYVVERNKNKINEELGNFINFFGSNQVSFTGNNIDFVYRLMLNFIDEKKKQETSELKNYNYYVFGTSSITNKKGFFYPLSLIQYSDDKLVTFNEFPNINFYMPKSNINENKSEAPNYNEFNLINYNEKSQENHYNYIVYGTRNNKKGFYYPLSLVSFDNDHNYIFDEYPNIQFYMKEKEPSYNISLRPKNYNDYLDYKYIYIDNKKPKIFNNNLEETFNLDNINDERERYLNQNININNSALLDPDAQISTINEVTDSVIVNLDIEVDFQTLLLDELRTQLLEILGQSMNTNEIVNILFYPGSIKIHILVNTDDVPNFENNLEAILTSQDFQLPIPNIKPDTNIVVTGPDIKVDRNRIYITILSVVFNDVGYPSVLLSFRTDRDTVTFTLEDINAQNGVMSNLLGSGKEYTAVFTPELIGVCKIQVPENTFTDFAGEPNLASNVFLYKFDEDPPNITITSVPDNIVNYYYNNNVSFRLEINEDNFFEQSNLTIINGTISNFTILADNEFTFDFTPTADGVCQVRIEAGEFTDYSANFNLETVFSWTHDTVIPEITFYPDPVIPIYQLLINHNKFNSPIWLIMEVNKIIELSQEYIYNQLRRVLGFIDRYNIRNISPPQRRFRDNKTQYRFYVQAHTPNRFIPIIHPNNAEIRIEPGRIVDRAGNRNVISSSYLWNYDTIPPTFTFSTSSFTNGQFNSSFNLTISISTPIHMDESVEYYINSILTLEKLRLYRDTLTNPLPNQFDLISNFTMNDTNDEFTITIDPTQGGNVNGNYILSIPDGSCIDFATNQNNLRMFSWVHDTVGPIITISSPNVADSGYFNNNVNLVITFNEEIDPTSFTINDIICVGGSINTTSFTEVEITGGNHIFNAVFEPENEGIKSVIIDPNTVQDLATNLNPNSSNRYEWTHDITPPTVTITAPVNVANGVNYYNGSNPVLITLTLSEPLSASNPINLAGVITSNGSVTNLQEITPTQYTVDFTIENQGDCAIQIDVNTIKDRSGNFNDSEFTYEFTYDSIQPIIQIQSSDVVNTGFFNNQVTLVFTISEAIHPENTFVEGDISFTNCSLGTLTDLLTNPPSFSIIATPIAEGSVSVNVDAAKFTDLALNDNTASNVYSWTHDSIQPDVTISTTTPNIISEGYGNQNVAFTFTVSELVHDTQTFINSDITVNNGVISALTNIGAVYTGTFTPTGEGLCSISVPADSFTDRAGNFNIASNEISWIHDITNPVVTIITNTGGLINNGFYNNNVIFTIEISEDVHSVNNFTSDKITATNGSIISFTDNGMNGLVRTFTVEFEPDFEGVSSINVAAGEFTDRAGNNNTASNTFSWTHDISPPSGFSVGNIVTLGAPIVAGFINISNTGINVDIPVANDSSLENGKIQLLGRTGTNAFTNLGPEYTINVADKGTTVTLNITTALLGGLVGYTDGTTFNIGAIITDNASNSITGTPNPINFVIDLTAPTLLTVGSISTAGTNNFTNGAIKYFNSTNTGVNIIVPIDDDNTLQNGQIQLQAKYGTNVFTNILTAQTITTINTDQTINLSEAVIEGFPGFNDNITILFRAIVTDRAGNSVTFNQSTDSLFVNTISPIVNQFDMTNTQLIIGQTSTVTLQFSKAVTNFNSNADITFPANGSLSTMTSANDITWTGTYTPNVATEEFTNVLTLADTYTDTFGNPGVTEQTANFEIDTIAPLAFTVGAISSDGGTVVANRYNATNTSVTITVPVDNDSSLVNGTVQLEARVQTGTFDDIGSVFNISNPNLGTNINVTVADIIIGGIKGIEEITNFADSAVLEFRAKISDRLGNITTGTASSTLLTVSIAPTSVTTFRMEDGAGNVKNTFKKGDTGVIVLIFSKNVTNLDLADFTTNDGTISNLRNQAGQNSNWLLDYTPNDNIQVNNSVINLGNNYIDEDGNVGVTANFSINIDTSLPSAFTITSITPVGPNPINVVAGFWNSVNSSVDIIIPIDNDSSLENGNIQIEARVGTDSFGQIGNPFTINNGDLGNNKTLSINDTILEGITNYAEGVDIEFRAIISDSFTNSTISTNSLSLTVKENPFTVDIFSLSRNTFKIGETAALTIQFSEAVTNLTNVDIDLANANGTLTI